MVSQVCSSLDPERDIPHQLSTIGEASAIGKNSLVSSELRDQRYLNQSMQVLKHTHIKTKNMGPHKQKIGWGVGQTLHFHSPTKFS